jgi:hypothetical protein
VEHYRHVCVDASNMHVQTKFLRLREPVSLGDRINDWRVCWLGGGTNAEYSSSLWWRENTNSLSGYLIEGRRLRVSYLPVIDTSR